MINELEILERLRASLKTSHGFAKRASKSDHKTGQLMVLAYLGQSVSEGPNSATYGCLANSALVGTLAMKQNATVRLTPFA